MEPPIHVVLVVFLPKGHATQLLGEGALAPKVGRRSGILDAGEAVLSLGKVRMGVAIVG